MTEISNQANYQLASAFKGDSLVSVRNVLKDGISDGVLESSEINKAKEEFKTAYKKSNKNASDAEIEKKFYSGMENIVGIKGVESIKKADHEPVEFNFEINRKESHKGEKVLVSGGIKGKEAEQITNYFEVNNNEKPVNYTPENFKDVKPSDEASVTGNTLKIKGKENINNILELKKTLGLKADNSDLDLKTIGKFLDSYVTAIKKGDSETIEKLNKSAPLLAKIFNGTGIGETINTFVSIAAEKDASLKSAGLALEAAKNGDKNTAQAEIAKIKNNDVREKVIKEIKE
jgi:hypothetical protein